MQTSTGTSNSRRANKHQYINAKAIKSRIPVLLGTNSYFDQSQYFRTIYPNLQFCYFKFRQKSFGSVFLPSCLSVEHNLNLNFSLNQRDNILLVTFLNQSSTHRLVYLLHIRVRVTALGLRSVREQNLAHQRHINRICRKFDSGSG